jgi:hypothetical protein
MFFTAITVEDPELLVPETTLIATSLTHEAP